MGADGSPTGDELLKALAALGNPHRMRIIEALFHNRNYVSRLAREIGMGRPLLHMHLQRLEAAGLVVGSLEVGEGGKTVKYFEVAPFAYELTPRVVAEAARTITAADTDAREKERLK